MLWRWEGITYHGFMFSGSMAAAIYNSQRTKKTEKVWSWPDLHPMHAKTHKGATGLQLLTTAAAMGDGTWDFLPGYGFTE